jgi:ankyrin repeat protein
MKLLKAKEDVKALYSIGTKKETLLHYAVSGNSKLQAQKCIELGLSGIEKDVGGVPALHTAIAKGRKEFADSIIYHLVKNGKKEALNRCDSGGVTSLMLAIKDNCLEIIKKLIYTAAEISHEKNNRHLPLNKLIEKATFADNKDNANQYLELAINIINNLNIYAKDGFKQTPIDILQGKILKDKDEYNPNPLCNKLLIKLVELDLDDKAIFLINNASLLLKQVNFENFKKIVDKKIANDGVNNASTNKSLACNIYRITEVEKIKYLKKKKMNLLKLSRKITSMRLSYLKNMKNATQLTS